MSGYGYSYGYNEELVNILAGVIGFLAVFMLIAAVISLVMYIFQAVGVYTIAKRRGIKHAWLAWIPVASYWAVGCIADQYRYVAKGQVKNRRTIMLTLAIISAVLSGVTSVSSGAGISALLEQMLNEGGQIITQGVAAGGAFGVSALLSLVSSGVSIALTVFWFISLYDLYTSCDPKNNVVFLVLGIIFSFLNAFFIFANRKKDRGMPPRKQPMQQPIHQTTQQPTWQPSEPPKEPWEENHIDDPM